ncbi:MAG: type VI secretion system tip protein VgrG [Candidatus Brocadia sp.]|nr:type VI secretion system tip protein VgrG [Candidatus Brocadia sp.]
MPYTQDNRLIAIETPLGKDVLLLTGFHGTEGLSTPFSFELDLLSENHSIPFKDIIGKNVAVSVVLANGEKRYFHGLISRFSQGRGGGEAGGDPRLSHYSATMVPWLWLLTKTADSRVFQNKSVPDIVEKIFQEKGFLDFKNKLQGSYDTWDYCVQYRETDFNFVSRLLEEEGIYYFFEHEKNKHTLILSDTPEEHKPCPKQETARYQISAGGWLEEDTVSSLEIMQEITAGKYTLKDFNFETPNTDLKIEAPSQKALGPGEKEIYDYPGGYGKRNRGDTLANVRMQEEEAGITTITGSSECRAFTSGYKFDLKDYYRKDMNNKAYVLTSLGHSARQGYATEDAISEFSYANNFTCIPFEIPYRPPRRTPKPVVEGVQTAIVVGPSGEEIYTDEHGRVKVQFHWDREGKKDDKSSCWIRVSQLWAGAGWGAMYIPRIGQEVIIDFLEGDPDCPIIIGRVYHGTNKPPYGLPGEKTKSTIKSDSSKGGGGSNEIRFEDKKGEEEIFIHAQKDENIVVENNQTIAVGNDRVKEVVANQTEKIGKNKTINVNGYHEESIKGNMTQKVSSSKNEAIALAKALFIGGAYQVSVGGLMNETVAGAKTEEVGGFKGEIVGARKSETIGGSKTFSTGKDLTESVGGNQKVTIAKNLEEEVSGKHTEQVSKEYTVNAKEIQLMGEDKITFKTGKAEIVMKKNGDITINGKKIQIKGSGDVVVKGSNIKEN